MSKGDKLLLAAIIICGVIAALIWFIIGKAVELLFTGSIRTLCFGLSVFAIILVVVCCIGVRNE